MFMYCVYYVSESVIIVDKNIYSNYYEKDV